MTIYYTYRQEGSTALPTTARVYGHQSTTESNKLVLWEWDLTASRMKFLIMLASGGRFGCDGIDQLRYNGGLLDEFSGEDRNWFFHPGIRTTGYADPVQGRPYFFPTLDFVFDGKCYVEGMLPSSWASDGNPPQGFEIMFRGLKVLDYELDSVNGLNPLPDPIFSANNALVSLDLLTDCAKFPLSRFNRWGTDWLAFRDTCDVQLEWDDGTAVHMVDRFNSHVVFANTIDPLSAWAAVMLRAPGVKDQDVNGAIRPLVDLDREEVHTLLYDPSQVLQRSNIVKKSFSGQPRDISAVPNFWLFTYRDLLDPDNAYPQKSFEVDYAELRDQADGILNVVGPMDLGVMTGSLAQRIGRCISRQISSPPYWNGYNVTGQIDSLHVAKNDYINLVHKTVSNNLSTPILGRVTRETYESGRKGERKFVVQGWSRDFYRDDDHGPLTQWENYQPRLILFGAVSGTDAPLRVENYPATALYRRFIVADAADMATVLATIDIGDGVTPLTRDYTLSSTEWGSFPTSVFVTVQHSYDGITYGAASTPLLVEY
jgi:hypothetical protein